MYFPRPFSGGSGRSGRPRTWLKAISSALADEVLAQDFSQQLITFHAVSYSETILSAHRPNNDHIGELLDSFHKGRDRRSRTSISGEQMSGRILQQFGPRICHGVPARIEGSTSLAVNLAPPEMIFVQGKCPRETRDSWTIFGSFTQWYCYVWRSQQEPQSIRRTSPPPPPLLKRDLS